MIKKPEKRKINPVTYQRDKDWDKGYNKGRSAMEAYYKWILKKILDGLMTIEDVEEEIG